MPEFDWSRIEREKNLHRDYLAALPTDERLRLIERLRDRGLEMKGGIGRISRDSVTNVSVSVTPPPEMTAVGAVHLNVLGASGTLVSAVFAPVNPTTTVVGTVTIEPTR